MIDVSALKIVKQLQDGGHTAYLVGGCVRDLLMGLTPKDFDISTTARPRQVKKLVRNAFIIGRRFRLVLVRRGEIQYEVSTFRRGLAPGEDPESLPDGDNIFGTPKQDAIRRDYTCNALFYDPIKMQVLDYTTGLKDMNNGWLKLIGEPKDRLPEDPIRILRAVRFAAKLNLQIDPSLNQGLSDYSAELQNSPLPRKREEYLKLLSLKRPGMAFKILKDLNVLKTVLPTLESLTSPKSSLRQVFNQVEHLDYEHRSDLDSAELMGLFIWSIAVVANPEFSSEDLLTWLKDDSIQNFAKFELGVFNAELTHIEQAFRLVPMLLDYETFKRKGARKQYGLLNQKAFPLALFFYATIVGPDQGLWTDAFNLREDLLLEPSDEKRLEDEEQGDEQ